MSPEERQKAIAELRKKSQEGSNPEAEMTEEAKNRRAERREAMKDMSPEERQAAIEKMKKKRDQRGEKNEIHEGGVVPKRP